MKIIINLLLFTFIVFLSTPTIMHFFEKNCDISIIDDFSDEDQSIKDLKIEFNFVETLCLQKNNFKKTTSIIVSKCKFKHKMIASKIFIPPPELV